GICRSAGRRRLPPTSASPGSVGPRGRDPGETGAQRRMARASILTVDDDPGVSQAVARDLRKKYGEQYRVVRATSGAEALDVLRELALRSEQVALIVSDHRMPEMTGVEFLEQSLVHMPDAKRVLLTAYADTDAAI